MQQQWIRQFKTTVGRRLQLRLQLITTLRNIKDCDTDELTENVYVEEFHKAWVDFQHLE